MKQIFYQQITNTWTFIFWILYLLYTVEGAPQRPVLNVRGSDCEACWKQLLWLFSTRPQMKMVHFCYWKPFFLMLTIARNHRVLNLAMEAWNGFQSLYRQKCRISFFSWLMQCVGQYHPPESTTWTLFDRIWVAEQTKWCNPDKFRC